jgi:hypothetical protein
MDEVYEGDSSELLATPVMKVMIQVSKLATL